MANLIVTVSPAGGGKFIADLDGRRLCNRTHSPFIMAARALMAEGYDPATVIVMRHQGSDTDCLISTIGETASVCVVEEQNQPPRFKPYRQGQDAEIDGQELPLNPGLGAFI